MQRASNTTEDPSWPISAHSLHTDPFAKSLVRAASVRGRNINSRRRHDPSHLAFSCETHAWPIWSASGREVDLFVQRPNMITNVLTRCRSSTAYLRSSWTNLVPVFSMSLPLFCECLGVPSQGPDDDLWEMIITLPFLSLELS